MIIRYQVGENIPLPARNVLSLVQAALKVNRSIASRLIHDGAVSAGGKVITQTHVNLRVGDELEIDYAPQPVKQAQGKSNSPRATFEVLHDDEAILVVNKPAGLLTVPSPHREKNTLRSQLQKWLRRQRSAADAICVHRLDRGVSGVLVFAKSEEVAEDLRRQFAQRKPKRKYAAIVHGNLEEERGTFESYLSTDPKSLNRYSVESGEGELAITHFEVEERWRDVTLVAVQLETGRRNQIRVHFAEAKHPILGDPRYRPDLSEHPLWPFKRLALHAETLGFVHPKSHSPLLFKAPWPQEFRDLRRRLSKARSPKNR